jgi:hypothetical protein
MAEVLTLKIQWMDRDEPYILRANMETRVSDGVLHVYEYEGGPYMSRERHYPLSNIRHWDKKKG